jgi:hypothetical protein
MVEFLKHTAGQDPQIKNSLCFRMSKKAGFQLQESDLELLHFTHDLRLATIDHLSALSGRSVRALWNRLLKLKKQKYLSSVARFMQRHVYAVGTAGAAVLTEAGFAPGTLNARRLRHRELSEIGIRHSLFIADIHSRVLLETRSGPIRLHHWQEGPTLWDSVIPRQGEAGIPIRPDAYFVLKRKELLEGRNCFHIFLDADRSTMSHERMAQKVSEFLAYYEQRLYARKYPDMPRFLVATVTQTQSRASELRADLYSLIPRTARQAYLFIPFEDLTLTALLPKAAANTA